ncbi:hypothetical protein AKJ18_00960 [Vibrio xuii]|nr:hypothetical protein AKJ18_00960 [Vibrio xuii]
MNSKQFPFFAGQRTDKTFGSSHVLSPLPIKTLLSSAGRCDQLVRKKKHYIDLGGAGGMILQTQIMWMIFLMGFASFAWFYLSMDGFSGMYESSFKDTLLDGHWERRFQPFEFFIGLFFSLLPVLIALIINYKLSKSAQEMLSQSLPCRFHRQRREVLFSRWDNELKKVETRIVPWEKVCAMVGQSSGVTTGGVFSSASLIIATNDEENYGNFWSALQIGAVDKFHAASIWEMIRTFMEEGAEHICDPSPLTLEGIIDEHCQANNITKEEFSGATRFWWYINGTMLGIWRTNYEMSKVNQRAENYTDIEAWSEALPESEWQKPSVQLNYVNDMLARNEYAQGHTVLSIGDACSRYMQHQEAKIG